LEGVLKDSGVKIDRQGGLLTAEVMVLIDTVPFPVGGRSAAIGNTASPSYIRRMPAASSPANQLSLFAIAPVLPDGLRYGAEFVARSDEANLITSIRELPLEPFQFGAFEGKRRVVSFGWRYDYTLKRIAEAAPMPDWLLPLRDKVAGFIGQPVDRIRQVLVTEYEPGAGIGWHRDKPMFETIAGISLGSDCTFRLRRKMGARWERASVIAAARSIYTMDGPARHQWEHSIPGVDAMRYSITFRTMTA
jgi:alkylated DNA repair dioxygenase AlkB